MYNIFIALFGGLFYGSKIGSEKAAKREYDRQQADRAKKRDAWMASVTNKELENKLRNDIYNPTMYQVYMDEVNPVCLQAQTGKSFDELYPFNLRPVGKKYTMENLELRARGPESDLRILMAKRGYLTSTDALNGFYKSLSFHTPYEREIFMLCVEELRKHGICNRFVEHKSCGQLRYGWEI